MQNILAKSQCFQNISWPGKIQDVLKIYPIGLHLLKTPLHNPIYDAYIKYGVSSLYIKGDLYQLKECSLDQYDSKTSL